MYASIAFCTVGLLASGTPARVQALGSGLSVDKCAWIRPDCAFVQTAL